MKLSLLAAAMLFAQAAAANEYSALLKAHKYADAERIANAKLAQDPANPEAIAAKVEAILPAGRYDEAAKLGEQCIAAHPQVSNCHLWFGNALGSKALSGGMMSMIGSAGTIRDAFKKAVELDPQNVGARMSLLTFYMQAPGIAGGGSGKAHTLAAQTAAINPDAARVMQARLDASDDKVAKAEAAVLAMPVSANDDVADAQRDLINNLGFNYLSEKKYADSERLYREALRRFPDNDVAVYGLARVHQEQGRHREALAGMEQVLAMNPRAGAWYRIGQSQLALGDKSKATAAYEKALAYKTGLSAKMRADAEEQLKALKR
ncbi:tetratricopeptide repeat protein [Massilia sp. R2A-15]|uniref:tetratricopeptide repeat protein n=1 Tax=Massilia sp. R2A-15 TaxID=3064278 RepID=UPI00273448FB|nr:tetratricopeptide repeat protein [Massilia sp. R2A-15]WLI87922.1 tetratricopeptide repeat protein [Massilia sp. R2A-15]